MNIHIDIYMNIYILTLTLTGGRLPHQACSARGGADGGRGGGGGGDRARKRGDLLLVHGALGLDAGERLRHLALGLDHES